MAYMNDIGILKLTNTDAVCLVSSEDLPRLLHIRWCLRKDGYVFTSNYKKIKTKYQAIYLHRLVLDPTNTNPLYIDHINRIKLDNRQVNLRFCSQSDNLGNCKKRLNASSKYRGVSFSQETNKYRVQIQYKGEVIYGHFHVLESDAAKEANEFYLKYFGEFATLNVIES